jgi:hypothetical protein
MRQEALLDWKTRRKEQHMIGQIEHLVGDRPNKRDLDRLASTLNNVTLDAIGVASIATREQRAKCRRPTAA